MDSIEEGCNTARGFPNRMVKFLDTCETTVDGHKPKPLRDLFIEKAGVFKKGGFPWGSEFHEA